jgi:hypothetical protein
MKVLIAAMLSCSCSIGATFAQNQEAPSSTKSATIVLLGSYRGDIKAQSQEWFNGAFKVVVAKVDKQGIEGTLRFYRGELACQRGDDIVGSIADDGAVRISTTDKVVRGCDRSFVLKVVSETQLIGSVNAPRGNFEVKLTKE